MSDFGGDPACWLDRVCDRCGAMVEDDDHKCGAPIDRDQAVDTSDSVEPP